MSWKCIGRAVIGIALAAGTSAHATPVTAQTADCEPARYSVQGGTVTFDFDVAVLDALGLRFIAHSQLDGVCTDAYAAFEIEPSSTLAVEAHSGAVGGVLRTRGALLLDKAGERVVIGNFTIEVDSSGPFAVKSTLGDGDAPETAFALDSVMLDFSAAESSLRLIGELSIARSWAPRLDIPRAAGTVLGTVVVDASMAPTADASAAMSTCEGDVITKDASRSTDPTYSDVIVADLQEIARYGTVDGITAFAVATNACNLGTARANWIADTNEHPAIVQNAYRLKDDRFEQIGLAWIKHGFYAVSQSLCSPCEDATDGSELGVGCSDPYSAALNGIQTNMSPRSIIDANMGYFVYDLGAPPAQTVIERRLQIHETDLDPALNPGARYFVQGHYVMADDALARTHNNNASYREVKAVESEPGVFTLAIDTDDWPARATQREQPAVRAWQDVDPSVVETDIQIPDEGLFILAAKVIDLGSGIWRYEYALQNLNSDRSAGSFRVPLPEGVTVTNIGFHDIDYHSGDPWDPTDWVGVATDNAVIWSSQDYDPPEEANALRWGTVYNFRFDVNAWADPATITIGLFKPPRPEYPDDPVEITAQSIAPTHSLIDCNGNEISDACDLSCDAPDCVPPCGASSDCDGNAVPDECQPDCNDNEVADICDVVAGTSDDCNGNNIPDECEVDCNRNEVTDWCDINDGTSEDCNLNDIPDECEIDENSTAPGGPFFCTENCDVDCNSNGIPDACDLYSDDDNDRVFGCDDLCPFTNPGFKCACNEKEDCCFPHLGYCHSDMGLAFILPAACILQGGVPQCNLSPLCRYGCLVGDVDDNGIVDIKDIGGIQLCFGVVPEQDNHATCLRIFDFGEDGAIDLRDYDTFAELFFDGIP